MRPTTGTAHLAIWLGSLSICVTPARAQAFLELGGGWSYMAPAPASQNYSRSYDIRASIGQRLSRDVLLRFDAVVNQFDETVPYISHFNNPGCPIPSCSIQYYDRHNNGVAGLTANAIANLDARGFLYVIAGAGIYDTYGGTPRLSTGVSAGGGVTVPLHARLRLFVEARSHFLLGANEQPPWVAPITIGLRW
jgi:hypothetical protein